MPVAPKRIPHLVKCASVGRPSAIFLRPSSEVLTEGRYLDPADTGTSSGGLFRKLKKTVVRRVSDAAQGTKPIFQESSGALVYTQKGDVITSRHYHSKEALMDAICAALDANPGMDQLDLANKLRVDLRAVVDCIEVLLKERRIEPA